MRIPPYYQYPSWQRFFAGAAIGALISWFVFLYMFGVLQEKQVRHVNELNEQIADLQNEIRIWQEDYIHYNKEMKKKLTVQDVSVHLANAEQYKLDSYTTFRIEDSVKEDLSHLITKDIETVYNSRELIERAIENKTYTIHEKTYRLELHTLTIFTLLAVEVKLAPLP
ncbi:sporulation membrane protein YtrI [Geobacillus thermoleovorans]|uniref:Putative sporulation membrane protein ytrI n=1 Tax=Geobacillus kaustophilus TaxID=1462 RepID=A0A0D8BY86_GEOKU|nr:sporulation membrane protein YtrI [Geobacillus kaustophilus]KJE28954.1 putative sporulation membrane protein ytrI [Geobacillus kaustophilus]